MSLLEAVTNKKLLELKGKQLAKFTLQRVCDLLDAVEGDRAWPPPKRVARDLARKVEVAPRIAAPLLVKESPPVAEVVQLQADRPPQSELAA